MVVQIDVSSTKHYELLLPESFKKIQFNVSEDCKLRFIVDHSSSTKITISPSTKSKFSDYVVVMKYYAIDDDKRLFVKTREFTSCKRTAFIECDTLVNRKLLLDFLSRAEVETKTVKESWYDYLMSFAPTVTLVGSDGEVETKMPLMEFSIPQLIPVNGKINLENTSTVALESLVNFLETGDLLWTMRIAGELLALADKYAVYSLQRVLEENLTETDDNIRTAHRVLREQRRDLLEDFYLKLNS